MAANNRHPDWQVTKIGLAQVLAQRCFFSKLFTKLCNKSFYCGHIGAGHLNCSQYNAQLVSPIKFACLDCLYLKHFSAFKCCAFLLWKQLMGTAYCAPLTRALIITGWPCNWRCCYWSEQQAQNRLVTHDSLIPSDDRCKKLAVICLSYSDTDTDN